jgi:hypothetical protein
MLRGQNPPKHTPLIAFIHGLKNRGFLRRRVNFEEWEKADDSVNTESTKGLSDCVKSGVMHFFQKTLKKFLRESLPTVKVVKRYAPGSRLVPIPQSAFR